LKAHQPLPSWQSLPTASRRKVKFARVLPRGDDVSTSQPIDYNGNTIKPQVYSCPERALICLVLEDFTTANVFITSITSVKKSFYPCSQTEAQLHGNTPYQIPSKIRRSYLNTFQGIWTYRFAGNLPMYHVQGKKWSSKHPPPSNSSSLEESTKVAGGVQPPGVEHGPHHVNLPQISSWLFSTIP